MRRLLIMVAMAALVLAKPKPDSYREKEDFQYSRSSTDEGHKEGYYGAQRGNMGGNYERAHNMDTLAQHQMSGLVRQVDGELGEGAKTRTGSVFTSANSRGIYGSGNYDLSNLKGRNFQEGESFGNSQSHSSLTSHSSGYRGHSYSGMNSAGYSSSSVAQDSSHRGYQSLGHADQRQIDNLQSIDMSQGHGRYENDNQAGYNMKYHSQYGSHRQSEFDQSSTNRHSSNDYGSESQSRYITTPVKIVMRPGGRVAIPIVAPTYAVSENAQAEDKNVFNSDAEVLNQHANILPASKVKHYESSYSYRKEWEKHHTIPADGEIVVPTENPFPKNSELYDEAQLLQSSKDQFQSANLQTAAQTTSVNSQHRFGTKSAAARSRYQSGFNSQHSQSDFDAQQGQSGLNAQNIHSSASSDSYANAYRNRAQQSVSTADLTNAVENVNLKPKSYHSSYSYHKSWERQGDPYVIKPVGASYDGQASQRLSASASNSAAYSAHNSHSSHAHQRYSADADCDEEGHIRVARSYNTGQELEQYNLDQQTQNGWDKLEDLGQQTSSNLENLELLGQQQQNKWDNLQDLGQQTQNQWDNLQQLGQQSQNQWDNLQQLGQESQNQWDNLQQLGQQTQDKWDKLEDLGQQTQRDLEQRQNENIEDLSQHTQKEDAINNFEQRNVGDVQQVNNNSQESNVHINAWDQTSGFEQSNIQNTEDITQHTHSVHKLEDININGHNLQISNQKNPWYQSQDLNLDKTNNAENFMKPNSESKDDNLNVNMKPTLFQSSDQSWNQNNQDDWIQSNNNNFHNHFWHMNEFKNYNNQYEHNFHTNHDSTSDSGKAIQSLWDKIDNIAGEFSASEGTTGEKKLFSYDYFNNYSNNRNVEHTQNENSWGYVQTDEQKNSEHHNLFDDEIQSSTTEKFNETTSLLTKPARDKSILTNTQAKPSADEGRGDIGPEEFDITSADKSYKTPEEIETLSLTKGNNNTNILEIRNFTQSNHNQNTQNKLFNSLPPQIPSTTYLPIRISTTVKSYERVDSNKQDSSHEFQFSNNGNTELQKNELQEHATREELVEQQIDQHFNDFGQQLVSAWSSNSNLDQGYNQQNVEQQFEVFHQNEFSKPNSEEIETLNLSKVPNVAQTDNTFELTSIQNANKDTNSNVPSTNTVSQGSTDEKRPHKVLFLQASQSTTKPSIQISTTPKNNRKPVLHVLEVNTLPKDQNHKPLEKIPVSIEIPEDVEQHNLEQQFEDFGQQLQNPWQVSETMQNSYDQQNMEQQFDVFHPQENMQDQSSLLDFGQHMQSSLHHSGYMHSNLQAHQDLTPPIISSHSDLNSQTSVNSKDTNINSHYVETIHTTSSEPIYNDHKEYDYNNNRYLQSRDKVENVESIQISKSNLEPTETSTTSTSTEKPGFWKSVGNKFSNAKDKVFSWFKRS